MTNPRDLVQLRALYQAGLLDEDEYTEARRRLLGYKVKRGRAVPPTAQQARPPQSAPPPTRARTQSAPPPARTRAQGGPLPTNAPPAQRRSVNSQREVETRRNPNSDLPLLFALGALAIVALAATIWFLIG